MELAIENGTNRDPERNGESSAKSGFCEKIDGGQVSGQTHSVRSSRGNETLIFFSAEERSESRYLDRYARIGLEDAHGWAAQWWIGADGEWGIIEP